MNPWWDIDDDVLACLEARHPMTPAEISAKLGLSERTVTSLLALLAQQGKIRITGVESTPEAR